MTNTWMQSMLYTCMPHAALTMVASQHLPPVSLKSDRRDRRRPSISVHLQNVWLSGKTGCAAAMQPPGVQLCFARRKYLHVRQKCTLAMGATVQLILPLRSVQLRLYVHAHLWGFC